MRTMINDVSALTQFLSVLEKADKMLLECIQRTDHALQEVRVVWKDDKFLVFEASAKQYAAQLEAVRSELSSDCQTRILEIRCKVQEYLNLK